MITLEQIGERSLHLQPRIFCWVGGRRWREVYPCPVGDTGRRVILIDSESRHAVKYTAKQHIKARSPLKCTPTPAPPPAPDRSPARIPRRCPQSPAPPPPPWPPHRDNRRGGR